MKELAKPPGQRPPSEPEMRAAVDDRVQEELALAYPATPMNRVEVSRFDKKDCLLPIKKRYVCQYSLTVAVVYLPFSNDSKGRRDAEKLTQFGDWVANAQPPHSYHHTSGFTYDEGTKRWIRDKEPKLDIVRNGKNSSDARR